MESLITKYDEYNYKNIFEQATRFNATQKDIDKLGQWLDTYDFSSWNGEYFDAGEGVRVFPVYGEEDENGEFPLIGYEIC